MEQFAQAFVPIASTNDALCNYLTAGSVLVAITAQFSRHGSKVLRLTLPMGLGLLLLLYCYATSVWSIFPSTTLTALRTQIPYLVVFVGLAPLVLQELRDLEDCLNSVIISSMVSLTGIVLFATWGSRGIMIAGWEANPLALAQVAGALLIVATLTGQVRKMLPRTWIAALVAIGITCLVIFIRTAARGQTMAAFAIILAFSLAGKNKYWVPIVLLGVVALFGSGLMEEEIATNAARWDRDKMQGDMDDGRVDVALQLIRFWSSREVPQLVLGLGHAASQDPRLLGGYPHVVPLEVLAEEGILGFMIYVSAVGVAARYYLRAQGQYLGQAKPIVRVIWALFVFEFVLTFKQGTLLGAASFLLLLVLPGVLTRKNFTSTQDSRAG